MIFPIWIFYFGWLGSICRFTRDSCNLVVWVTAIVWIIVLCKNLCSWQILCHQFWKLLLQSDWRLFVVFVIFEIVILQVSDTFWQGGLGFLSCYISFLWGKFDGHYMSRADHDLPGASVLVIIGDICVAVLCLLVVVVGSLWCDCDLKVVDYIDRLSFPVIILINL